MIERSSGTLQRIASWHPILWLLGFTILLMAIGPFIPWEYDDQGLGSLLFAFIYNLTIVFRWASQLAYKILGDLTGIRHFLLTWTISLSIYVGLDFAVLQLAQGWSSASEHDS